MNIQINSERLFVRFAPPVTAVVLIGAFMSLGFWQLDRAEYKKELAASFDSSEDYTRVFGDMPTLAFQPVSSVGRYLGSRQFLIDNIVKDGRLGFYVLTPFEFSTDEALLLVNRGWVPKQQGSGVLPDVSLDNAQLEIRGKVGNVPRVGIRPGEAFEGASGWPLVGVYPTLQELSDELGRDVLPFVMLLDPDPQMSMVRQWEPVQSGPSTHYGYAFQWFALAAAVVVVWIRQILKRRSIDDT